MGEEPSEAARQQQVLYDQFLAEPDADKRTGLMEQIMDIAKAEFWAIGITLPEIAYGITNKKLYNVPLSFPGSFAYPDPAPLNVFTFYFGEPRDTEPYRP